MSLYRIRRAAVGAWTDFWLRRSGLAPFGRLATRLGALFTPPYRVRVHLARRYPQGFIAPSAIIHHSNLELGRHVFMGDHTIVFQQGREGDRVRIGDHVQLVSGVVLETGEGGCISIGSETRIQPGCRLSAYKGSIHIGRGVDVAANCAFYPYNHGIAPGTPVRAQPLESSGDIVVEDDAWLGYGVIVLDGVRIGQGAVVGAGSVVTRDVPAGAVAVGSPARVVKMRSELGSPRASVAEGEHTHA
jgi:acetyltransferase-like isoleucine patch superfamily enzyme